MATDLLRAVLDSLTDPIVVLRAVRDERGAIVDFSYVDANEAACRDNRRAHDDLIGQRLLALYPNHGPTGLFAQYANVVETGQALVLNDQAYDHEFYVGEDRYFDIRCAPVDDGVTLTWRDVTDRHLVRQELRGTEARFRNLAEHASDVVYFAGSDQVIRWASPSVTSVLGWSIDDVVGRHGADFLHPDDRDATEAERMAVYSGGDLDAVFRSSGPLRVRTKSGEYRWMSGSLTRVPAEGTEPAGVVASWRDVDDLVRAQQLAEAERERARAAVSTLLDPQVVLTAERDATGAIVDFVFAEANPAACAFNQLSHDELVGSRLVALHPVPGTMELLHVYARVVETGEPLVRDDWAAPEDMPGYRRYFDMRAVPLGDGISLTWRDVTDRHETAAALERSRARFRLLAENSTDVVFELDAAGRIGWASPSATDVLGWSVEDLRGMDASVLVADDDIERLREHYRDQPATIVRVRAADGSLRPFSIRITVFAEPDGTTSGAVVGMTDVAELVEARDQARTALAAEARTRLSMDEAAIGIVIAERDGTITYANPALHRMFGAPDGAMVGRSIEGGSRSADTAVGREAADRLMDGRSATEHLRRSVIDFAGSHLWVDAYLSPIRGADGDVEALLVQVVDVTAEVANRESLARSLDHFRLLAENATDVVYETDRQGAIVWMSPSVREALGWEPDALLGTRAVDLVHPDDRGYVEHERSEVYAGRGTLHHRVRFRTLRGQDRTMAVTARPLQSDDGVVTGAVVGLRDVTDEAAANEALERSERLFRAALEEAPTGMALADPDDRLVEVNPTLARMLGTTPEELVGHRLRDFLRHGDEADPTCAEILVATGETRIENHEHQVLDDRSGTAWVGHSVSVVRDRTGSPLFFVHQVIDITTSKQREEDLGYRASHDLLTGLLNREGLLARLTEWLPDDSSRSRLALLYCDVDRLKSVNDTYGHAAGDAVLTEIAQRMRTAVRRGDIVSRISGDEFVIVLDRIRDVFDALAVAEKVRSEVHGPVTIPDGEVLATVSIGAAVSSAGDGAQDVLARADEALYRAKVAGRDRVST